MFNDNEKQDFLNGFLSVVAFSYPGYRVDEDTENHQPLCQPWVWTSFEEYATKETPYESGIEWAEKWEDEISYRWGSEED